MFNKRKQNKGFSQKELINNLIYSLKKLIVAMEREISILESGKLFEINRAVEKKINTIIKLSESQNDLEDYVYKGGSIDKTSTSFQKLKTILLEMGQVKKNNEIVVRSHLEVNSIILEKYKESKVRTVISEFGYNKEGSIPADIAQTIVPSIGINNRV